MKPWENRLNNLSYTDRDASAIRQRLVDYIKENYSDEITDFNESSLIMMLIELLSGTSDMLQYRIDRQALESYLPTAKQRSNIKAILTSLGYRFEMATPATGYCKAEIPQNSYVSGNGVTVLKGTQLNCYDANGEKYPLTVTSTVLVPYPGGRQVKLPVAQGIWSEMKVKVSDIIDSTRLYLNTTKNTSVARKYVELSIAGESWKNVDDVLRDDTETNKTFSVFEDKYDRPYILFHRNYSELLKSSLNLEVTISYLETLGTFTGGEGLSISSVNSFTQVYKNDISAVRFSELSVLSGGSPRETEAHAKTYAPKVFKTMNRAVTLKDFESLVGRLSGVSKVRALDWKSKYVTTPYLVILLVAPTGGTMLSENQISEIEQYLAPKMLSTVTLTVRSASYVRVDVEADLYVNGPEADFTRIRTQAIENLQKEFTLEKSDFGDGINASNVITILETSDSSIEYVDLLKPKLQEQELIDPLSIYLLGDVTVNVKGRY